MFSTLLKACSEAFGILVSPLGGIDRLGRFPTSVPKADLPSFEHRTYGTKSPLDLALMGITGARSNMWTKSYKVALKRQAMLAKHAVVEEIIGIPPLEFEAKDKPRILKPKMVKQVVFGPSRPEIPISRAIVLHRPPLAIDGLSPHLLCFLFNGTGIPRGIWIPSNTCRELVLFKHPVTIDSLCAGISMISGNTAWDGSYQGIEITPPIAQGLQERRIRPRWLPQPPPSEVSLPTHLEGPNATTSSNACRALVVYQPVYRHAIAEQPSLVISAVNAILKRILTDFIHLPRLYYVPSIAPPAMESGKKVAIQQDYHSLAVMLSFKAISANVVHPIPEPAVELSASFSVDCPVFSTSTSFGGLSYRLEHATDQEPVLPRSVSFHDYKSRSLEATAEDISTLVISMLDIKIPDLDWFEEVESAISAQYAKATEQLSDDLYPAKSLECSTPVAPEQSVMALVMGYIDSSGPSLGVVVSVTPSESSLHPQDKLYQNKPDPAILFAPPLSTTPPCIVEVSSTSTTESQQDCVALEGQGASLPLSLKEETSEPESPVRRRPRFDRGGGALFRNAIGGIKTASGSRRASV
ncbi:hypothetical protein HGRIS_002391 [Hohenbuehelia grisea]|uniref:Uncharacterized protein n=1 Tax=Hohenbuehelia grisea TaxID=104357 RepID=A0ABR3JLK2_9AGAR